VIAQIALNGQIELVDDQLKPVNQGDDQLSANGQLNGVENKPSSNSRRRNGAPIGHRVHPAKEDGMSSSEAKIRK